MSREFEVVVTEGMVKAMREYPGVLYSGELAAALAHPDFRAQLRAWAAEEMRGLVAARRNDALPSHVDWNACRAETLANITAWEKANENE